MEHVGERKASSEPCPLPAGYWVLSVAFFPNCSHQGQAHHCSRFTENQTGSERERHLCDAAQPGRIRIQTKASETVKLFLFPPHLPNREGGRGSGPPTAFSDFAKTPVDSSPSPTPGGSGAELMLPHRCLIRFPALLGFVSLILGSKNPYGVNPTSLLPSISLNGSMCLGRISMYVTVCTVGAVLVKI